MKKAPSSNSKKPPKDKSEPVAVLGLGNWGTALAHHLARKGYPVTAWSREGDIVEGINRHHRNPHFQHEVKLAPGLRATDDFSEAAACETIVLALPSSALSEIVGKLGVGIDSSRTIVSAVKGLEPETILTPLQFIGQRLKGKHDLVVLSGPSFASDVVRSRPVGIVAASAEAHAAEKIAAMFSSESMRVYTSGDPIGVELGGILKNVIALAAGYADGLGLGDSARAGLITRGLAEMTRLAKALGAQEFTLFGLSGLGDLVMSATCDTSRNRTVGTRLGRGESLETVISSLGSVAEGVPTTPIVVELARKHGIEMPIAEGMASLLSGSATPQEVLEKLISRPRKGEF